MASASELIDERIKELGDWRGETLAQIRRVILKADPGIVEEWKWGGPVWSHAGVICTGETYKSTVKLTFAHGASLKDPARLFNSSLEGATRRAIDVREGEHLDEKAFTALIREAVSHNNSRRKSGPHAGTVRTSTASAKATASPPERAARRRKVEGRKKAKG